MACVRSSGGDTLPTGHHVFGLGIGELALFAVVLIVFVGPKHLPKLMKTVGSTLRTVRGATEELKRTVGYNDLMRAADVRRGLKQSLSAPVKPLTPAGGSASYKLTMAEREREHPFEGIDREIARESKAAAVGSEDSGPSSGESDSSDEVSA